MDSNKRDAFGLGGLANPSYAVHQSPALEQAFIAGSARDGAALEEGRAPEESTASALQKRLDEVEKRVGCSIFTPAQSDFGDSAASEGTSFSGRPSESRAIDEPADERPSDSAARYQSEPRVVLSTAELQHTEEAQRRDKLTSALSALSISADGYFDAEHERDRKLTMIEEITDLVALFRDDGEDVSHIQIPTLSDSHEAIQGTLKILKRHNDRKRFGTLADECIMLAATSLETLCNGEREWVGFKPDLRGWSNHVRSKLQRMHHDTSQIASSVMNDYNIGPGMRLMLELVPNLIMYARDKSMRAGASKGATSQGATSGGRVPASSAVHDDDPEFDSTLSRLRRT
jgi:hypothetical protein